MAWHDGAPESLLDGKLLVGISGSERSDINSRLEFSKVARPNGIQASRELYVYTSISQDADTMLEWRRLNFVQISRRDSTAPKLRGPEVAIESPADNVDLSADS